MCKITSVSKMYTKLSGEFDCMEFAESAARMIRERLDGRKKIVMYPNRQKYRKCAENRADISVADGNTVLMYPFCTHSNNFLSSMVVRNGDESQVNELLRTQSVRMEVICPKEVRDMAAQYMMSCGGYDLKK